MNEFPASRATDRKSRWIASLVCVSVVMAIPASAAPETVIERSIIVPGPPEVLWSRFGTFCAVAEWDPAFKSCRFLKGRGDAGTVRRIERRNGGPDIVDTLVEVSSESYRYRAVDGISEGVVSMTPGSLDDTTLVTWRIVAGPNASPAFRNALSTRLGPAVQTALETLARFAGGESAARPD